MQFTNFLIVMSGTLASIVIVLLATLFYLYFKHKSAREAAKDVAATGGNSKLAVSLRDEKQKSDIILNTIEDGVMLLDDQQVIQLFNPGSVKITGWSAEEARGLAWQSVVRLVNDKGEPYPEGSNPLERVFEEGQNVRDNDANLLTKADKQIAVNISLSPLLDEDQQVRAAVAILRDVSQERMEEAQRAEFISTASHEMRTPVAAIEGYLALALNEKVSTIDSHAREFLEKAHASTQHLGKLFQDLLTSAKAEDGRLTNHPVVIEMGGYLDQLAQDLKFSAEKKNLFTDFIIGSSEMIDASSEQGNKVVKPLYYIYADPDRLREVITNLFDNAVKYTETGKISLGLTGNDQVVQIYVRDTGPGIPAEDVPHLFQKFYRVDNSATRTIGGTGLGLFICRKIVELYEGRIWAESEVDKGSTFFINMPRLNSQKAAQLQASEAGNNVLTPITSLANS